MNFIKKKIIENINKNIVGKSFYLYGFYQNNSKSIDMAMWEEGGTCKQVRNVYDFISNKLPCWRFCDMSTKYKKYFDVTVKYEIISGNIEEALYLYQHNAINEEELAKIGQNIVIKIIGIKSSKYL
jgi:hypothetical protein